MSRHPPQGAAVVRTDATRELARLLHRAADVGGEWVAGALEEALVLGGVVDAHSAVLDGCGGRTHTHNDMTGMAMDGYITPMLVQRQLLTSNTLTMVAKAPERNCAFRKLTVMVHELL